MVLLFLFLSKTGISQNIHPRKRAESIFQKALAEYHKGDTLKSVKLLDKSIKIAPLYSEPYLLKGEIYFSLAKYKKSLLAYEKVSKLAGKKYPLIYFTMGKLNYLLGNYYLSIHYIKQFLSLKTENENLISLSNKIFNSAKYSLWAIHNPYQVNLSSLPENINSKYDEFVNYISKNDKLLFFTRKFPVIKGNKYKKYSENVLYSKKFGEKWENPKSLNLPWAHNLDMGAVSFSLFGKEMFVTGCYWPGGFGSCDIYISIFSNGKWNKPVTLGRYVNSAGWESQAVISPDGRSLYFASKRKGGKGGSDIWVMKKDENGNWKSAVNLGDSINTSGDEMSPFLSSDNKTLFFSSNGWPGLGEFDLFMSRKDEKSGWTKARNLGVPVNSRFSEKNIVVGMDGKQGWISSNRTYGKGYDIFRFDLYKKIQPENIIVVSGKVLDAENRIPLKANILIKECSKKTVSDTIYSAENGDFRLILPYNAVCNIQIVKPGYFILNKELNTSEKNKTIYKKWLLYPVKKGKKIQFKNILFDINEYKIKKTAIPELNNLVYFLKNNPSINILIAGYADESGTKTYNQKLSEKRADSVCRYLLSKGINIKRITCRGFGELKGNTDINKIKNRRITIVIE